MATDRLFNQTQGDSLISAVTALQSKGFTAAQITTLLSTLSGTNTALDAIRAAIASTSRGSVVSVTPAQSSGQAVGTVRVDNVDFSLFSLPTVARTQTALTSIADILAGQDAEKTATGNPVTITAKAAPVRALSVQIEPVQSGSGDPYPPGGGKNQCPIEVNTATVNGVSFTIDANAGTVTVNGTASQTTVFYLNAISNRYAGNDWIASGCPTSGSGTTYCLRVFNKGNGYATDTGSGMRFTGIDNLRCAVVVYAGITVNQAIFQPMIRLASDTDPTFAPYSNIRPITGWTAATVTRTGAGGESPETVTVSFGSAGTVYGGTLDVLAGKLTVTHKRWDLGALTWSMWNGFFWSTLDGRLANPETFLNASNCNILKRGVANKNQNLPDWSFDPFSYNDPQCYVALPGVTSTSAAKTWLQNNGAYIVGPLATPLTYSLTPAQLSTLAGVNVVYADCGPVSVRYIADISNEIADLRTKINALGGA